MASKGEVKQELLIIRRGPAEDLAAAKGGAWKIAYADFVTAMMAFFLVMWLINSANEVTKARVASYFNPIKMTDAAPVKKGLRENVEPNSQKTNIDGHQTGGETSSDAKNGGGQIQLSREELMENPMTALEVISEHSGKAGGQQIKVEQGVGDPFDPKSGGERGQLESKSANNYALAPDARQSIANRDDIKLQEEIAKAVTSAESDSLEAVDVQPVGREAGEKNENGEKARRSEEIKLSDAESAKDAQLPTIDAEDQLKKFQTERQALEAARAALKAREEGEALKLQREIRAQLADLHGALDVNVTVKVTSEGTLVVFEDGKKRSMFAIGSASPNPALITLLGKVGELLNKREEPVVIRGHTDGRRFRIETYDNWQLSTDRAHMASYMLIRGGLEESRLMRIEGYGSSQPAVPENVFADANRRVEFLLARPNP